MNEVNKNENLGLAQIKINAAFEVDIGSYAANF